MKNITGMKTFIGKFLLVILTVGILLFSNYPINDDQPFTGTIYGRVIDAHNTEPVSGADVILKPKGEILYTDSIGNYQFNEMEPGYYTIQISKLGYKTKKKKIKIVGGEIVSTELSLAPSNS